MSVALVLSVEDNPEDAALIQTWLEEFDIESICENRVAGAEKILRDRQVPFDAVLLDLNMPDSRTGDETYRRIKSAANGVPIIVLTGNTMTVEFMQSMARVGAFRTLSKHGGSAKYDVRLAIAAAVEFKRKRSDSPSSNHAVATHEWVRGQMQEALKPINEKLDRLLGSGDIRSIFGIRLSRKTTDKLVTAALIFAAVKIGLLDAESVARFFGIAPTVSAHTQQAPQQAPQPSRWRDRPREPGRQESDGQGQRETAQSATASP